MSDPIGTARIVTTQRRSTSAILPYLAQNLHRPVRLPECARLCALSPCEFSRRFRHEQGMTFSDYMMRLRIERACALIEDRPRSIGDVAYSAGFNDLSYFARIFRRYIGMTPTAYALLEIDRKD